MATGWAVPFPPKSGLVAKINQREWNHLQPESTGDTPPPQPMNAPWMPKAGPPRLGPNPMRRLPARREPEQWKEPKVRLFEDKEKENAQKNAKFGWGVSAPAKKPAAGMQKPARKGLMEQQKEEMEERRKRREQLAAAKGKQQQQQQKKKSNPKSKVVGGGVKTGYVSCRGAGGEAKKVPQPATKRNGSAKGDRQGTADSLRKQSQKSSSSELEATGGQHEELAQQADVEDESSSVKGDAQQPSPLEC